MYDTIVFAHLYKPHIGGYEKYIEELYTHQPKKKILIITSLYDKKTLRREIDRNIEIQRIKVWEMVKGKYYIPSFNGTKQIIRILRDNKDAEIHTHTRFYFSNFIATLLAQIYHQKHYHFEHGSSFVKDGDVFVRIVAWIFDHTLSKYVLGNSKKIFSVSESSRHFLNQHFGKLSFGPVIYNSYPFLNDAFKQRSKPKTLKLLYIGRIIRPKGIYELIDACALMKESDFQFTLTMIGDGSDMENIKRLIKSNNLGEYITLTGLLPFEKTQEEIKKYDILINPSYTEGLPTTVLEGLANSLFIVATDVGGTREIIPEEKLIPLEKLSGKSIEDKVVDIYGNWDKEDDDYVRIYKEARDKFSWDTNVKKFEESK